MTDRPSAPRRPPAGRAAPAGQPAHDLTTGPIGRTLVRFALPTLGANVLQSMNGSVNAVWIGRLLGEDALAASSNVNLVLFLLFALGFGFGMAATILVGQAAGRGDLAAARAAMGTAVALFVALSVGIAVAGWFAAPALLRLLATPAGAEALALAYLRVIFLGLPPMFLVVLLGMGLRGVGDSLTPLLFMVVNVVLDAGLNPLLIRGAGPLPALGIAGSATATLVANYAVLLGMVAYVYRRDLPLRLRGTELRLLRPDPALLRTIVAKGLPMAAQMLVMSLSGLVMIGLINRFGVDTAAAYGVAQQLWGYVQMPALAVGAAVSAMAAQNIGAGRWDRVARVTRAGVTVNLLMTGTLILAILLVDRALFTLFLGAGSPAIPIARHIQLVATWTFLPFSVTLVVFATVRANGAVVAPLAILTAGLFVCRLGFAIPLLPLIHADALWWSFGVSSLVTMGLALGYYRFGGWRRQGMMAPPPAPTPPTGAGSEPGGRLHPAELGAEVKAG